jgi:hypothetical protein
MDNGCTLRVVTITQWRNTMDNYTAVGICEGFVDSNDEEHQIEAWQHLIDTGLAWTLQGSFGRTAKNLIDEGVCHE